MRFIILRIWSVITLTAFLGTTLQMPQAHASDLLFIPKPGQRVSLSSPFEPAVLTGMTIHPDDPLRFDFLINAHDQKLSNNEKNNEYMKLVRYFMASLTVADENQWVNLSPYEQNRIVEPDFGQTAMGRDLLAQDYLLKQMASSLMYPEDNLGREFWKRVYAQAQKKLGHTHVPVQTINKVWIVPDRADIFEKDKTAVVLRSRLKVLLEEDYLALEKNALKSSLPVNGKIATDDSTTSKITQDVMKKVILPELEREVNEGKHFAVLRQMYSAMILSTWFKKALKESLLGKVYADQHKMAGINFNSPSNNEKIYQQYLKAYKQGAFNYIKEERDIISGQQLPRKYFSGGMTKAEMAKAMTVFTGNERKPEALAAIGTSEMAMVSFDQRKPSQPSLGDFLKRALSPEQLNSIEKNHAMISLTIFQYLNYKLPLQSQNQREFTPEEVKKEVNRFFDEELSILTQSLSLDQIRDLTREENLEKYGLKIQKSDSPWIVAVKTEIVKRLTMKNEDPNFNEKQRAIELDQGIALFGGIAFSDIKEVVVKSGINVDPKVGIKIDPELYKLDHGIKIGDFEKKIDSAEFIKFRTDYIDSFIILSTYLTSSLSKNRELTGEILKWIALVAFISVVFFKDQLQPKLDKNKPVPEFKSVNGIGLGGVVFENNNIVNNAKIYGWITKSSSDKILAIENELNEMWRQFKEMEERLKIASEDVKNRKLDLESLVGENEGRKERARQALQKAQENYDALVTTYQLMVKKMEMQKVVLEMEVLQVLIVDLEQKDVVDPEERKKLEENLAEAREALQRFKESLEQLEKEVYLNFEALGLNPTEPIKENPSAVDQQSNPARLDVDVGTENGNIEKNEKIEERIVESPSEPNAAERDSRINELERKVEALKDQVKKAKKNLERLTASDMSRGAVPKMQAQQDLRNAQEELNKAKAVLEKARNEKNLGGIDFNSVNLDLYIKRDGAGIMLPLDKQDWSRLQAIPGFDARIIDIKPVKDMPWFLNLFN